MSTLAGSRFERVISVIIAACVVVVSAVAVYRMLGGQQPDPVLRTVSRGDWEMLAGSGIRFGVENAPVRIVVFVDYECPFCRQYQQMIERLMQDGTLSFGVAVHDYPLSIHPGAPRAAAAAHCAEAISYSPRAAALYGWQDSTHSPDALQLAFAMGVPDPEAVRACIDERLSSTFVDSVRSVGERFGVNSTPTVLVDRDLFRLPPLEEELRRLLDKRR